MKTNAWPLCGCRVERGSDNGDIIQMMGVGQAPDMVTMGKGADSLKGPLEPANEGDFQRQPRLGMVSRAELVRHARALRQAERHLNLIAILGYLNGRIWSTTRSQTLDHGKPFKQLKSRSRISQRLGTRCPSCADRVRMHAVCHVDV